jgi:hypothetical protein
MSVGIPYAALIYLTWLYRRGEKGGWIASSRPERRIPALSHTTHQIGASHKVLDELG